MKKVIIPLIAAVLCAGCLSISRIPFPEREEFSDDGCCTNRTWTSLRSVMRERHPDWRGWKSVFPTVQARGYITYKMYFEEEDLSDMTGEQLYRRKWGKRLGWIPLTVIWFTTPADACIDILCMPWDVMEE